jgi:thiosulfate/3-mercaptopyruvate sulfurtransferase
MRKYRARIPFILLWLLFIPVSLHARDLQPIVSTDWLEKNLVNPGLVIVDIRKVEDYRAGHIPGSINVIYGAWAISKGGLDNEIPADDDLMDLLSSSGIGSDSHVVIVGQVNTSTDRVNRTRVAWTLIYAGVSNVAILDGGYNKWIADKKAISAEATKAEPKLYKGTFNRNVFANKEYVLSHLGSKTIIVDAREPDYYSGKLKVASVDKAGHIRGTFNLPISLTFNTDGTFKDKADLAAAASAVVGVDPSKEIIVYCNTGRESSNWWFLLHEVLGYKDVRNYDGSIQEWSKDANAPIEP